MISESVVHMRGGTAHGASALVRRAIVQQKELGRRAPGGQIDKEARIRPSGELKLFGRCRESTQKKRDSDRRFGVLTGMDTKGGETR
jgi:hypothetical protein